MHAILTELLSTGHMTAATGDRVALRYYLPQFEGEILQQWMVAYDCSRVVEVGFAQGISSLFIAEVLAEQSESVHHIIDPFQQTFFANMGLLNLKRAGFEQQIELYELDSAIALPQLYARGKRFDCAFIDGNHSFDRAYLDFIYCDLMMDVGGIVIFDDIHLDSIQLITEIVAQYDNYERMALPESAEKSHAARVRRLKGIEPARIVGFVKQAEDNRPREWCPQR